MPGVGFRGNDVDSPGEGLRGSDVDSPGVGLRGIVVASTLRLPAIWTPGCIRARGFETRCVGFLAAIMRPG